MLASVDVNTHDYDYDISSKHDKKVCRLFALGIISDAITAGWENEELARVIVLFTRKLHLSTKKTLAFIQACELKSVAIIAAIEDEGLILTTRNKIKTMLRWQNYDLDGFIAMMNDALELSVLYSNDMEVSVIIKDLNLDMTEHQLFRLLCSLCSHCGSKRSCGKILNYFIADMELEAAAELVFDCISRDFFYDLKGKMSDLKQQLPSIQDKLSALLSARMNLDDQGDIIESDDDGQGNLKDFITYDDVTGSGDEESDDDDDGDGNSDGDSLRDTDQDGDDDDDDKDDDASRDNDNNGFNHADESVVSDGDNSDVNDYARNKEDDDLSDLGDDDDRQEDDDVPQDCDDEELEQEDSGVFDSDVNNNVEFDDTRFDDVDDDSPHPHEQDQETLWADEDDRSDVSDEVEVVHRPKKRLRHIDLVDDDE